MAKKKNPVEIKLTGNRDAVAPGAVNIYYGLDLIGALNEDGDTARLLTAGTIVEKDIGVEYDAPEPATVTIPVYIGIDKIEPFAGTPITGTPGTGYDEYLTSTPEQFANKTVEFVTFTDSEYNNPVPFYGNVEISPLNGRLTVTCYVPDSIPDGADRILVAIVSDR